MYQGKLAVLCLDHNEVQNSISLAKSLDVPLYQKINQAIAECFFLTWRDGCLKLLDKERLKKGGLSVEIEPRYGEQHSWPSAKKGALAQAIGQKTKSIVDATTGWGQDSLHIFRMGYGLCCIERSPVMYALLQDGFKRLSEKQWVIQLPIETPELLLGNACDVLSIMDNKPECIYLDPMFPTKRKKSALAKKSMTVLRDLLGDDEDKGQLFEAAFNTATKKVIVKCPAYAEPFAGKPDDSFNSKLLRYDVYFKS